jgi:hypothetical protein
MNKETLRMQMLSGVITESEYKAKLEEATQKDSLNEHYVAGGIVGIGAINQIPSRTKAVYEDAFEHFLGQKYGINEMEGDVEEDLQQTDVKSAIDGKKLDLDKLKDATEKAMKGDSTDLTLFLAGVFEGKEVEEPSLYEGEDDLFTAKRFSKRTDNPRINILSHMGAINDIVMDMLETDLVKGYGPDERDDIYREYMKFANAVKTLVK